MKNAKHDRRAFLRVAGTGAALAAAAGRGVAQGAPQLLAPAVAASSGDLCFMSAKDLAALIRTRKVSAREVMAAHLERINRVKSAYWITTTFRPAISVPAGFTSDGLPIGLQIVGRHRDDVSVLQMAYAFEQATQIGNRRPSIT